MRRRYVSRAGVSLWMPILPASTFHELVTSGGWCLMCGKHVDDIDPYVLKFYCEDCGMDKVYGYEALLKKRLITFQEQEDEVEP